MSWLSEESEILIVEELRGPLGLLAFYNRRLYFRLESLLIECVGKWAVPIKGWDPIVDDCY